MVSLNSFTSRGSSQLLLPVSCQHYLSLLQRNTLRWNAEIFCHSNNNHNPKGVAWNLEFKWKSFCMSKITFPKTPHFYFLMPHSELYWLLFSMSFLMSLVIWFSSPQQIRNSKGEAEKRHSDSRSDSWKLDIEGGERKTIQ